MRTTGISLYGATKIFPGGTAPTFEQINRWVNSESQRNAAGGLLKWALDQNINVAKAITWLSNKGASTYGKARLNEKGNKITTEQMKAWNDMTQQQKYAAGGPLKWAEQQNISQTSALTHLTDTGLRSRTRQKFLDKGEKITTAQIKEWRELSEAQKKEAGGWLAWAQKRNIRPSNARHYLTNKGIKKLAVTRIAHAEKMAQIAETAPQAWDLWADELDITPDSPHGMITMPNANNPGRSRDRHSSLASASSPLPAAPSSSMAIEQQVFHAPGSKTGAETADAVELRE